ncbi:hypothetical protein [Streptomyces sp. UG1]|uniref:hypothetical protein n=1 Tax=Streptomyces sp. UG1 TaxID=3417652 RepID=UPI003CF723C9
MGDVVLPAAPDDVVDAGDLGLDFVDDGVGVQPLRLEFRNHLVQFCAPLRDVRVPEQLRGTGNGHDVVESTGRYEQTRGDESDHFLIPRGGADALEEGSRSHGRGAAGEGEAASDTPFPLEGVGRRIDGDCSDVSVLSRLSESISAATSCCMLLPPTRPRNGLHEGCRRIQERGLSFGISLGARFPRPVPEHVSISRARPRQLGCGSSLGRAEPTTRCL